MMGLFKYSLMALSAAASIASAGVASAATLTFDTLQTNKVVPNGYGGLNWTNAYALDTSDPQYAGTGYQSGTISGETVAYDGFGLPATFSSNTPFTLNSADFTAAFKNGLNVTVLGFAHGAQIYSSSFTLDINTPKLETFNWTGLNAVSFFGFGGTNAAPHTGLGTQVVLDNLTINEAIASPAPEPATWAMMIVGFGLAGFALRRAQQRSGRVDRRSAHNAAGALA